MKFLGDHPFYTLLLLTEKPGKWPPWSVAPLPLALAAIAGWAWGSTAGPAWGWATAALLLGLAVADWALLAYLPRSGSSFGPIQPPFLALSAARGLLTLLAAGLLALLSPSPGAGAGAAPAWGLQAAVQLAVWLLLAYGSLVEPFRVQVSHLEILTPRLPKSAGNPGRPLRIVQVSDLHVERLTHRDRALPGLVAGLQPDLVVLTGDYLNTSYNDDPRATADLGHLLAHIGAVQECYAIWGTPQVDHPHLLRPVLEGAGITILEDRAEELRGAHHHLWVMGVNCTYDLAADAERLGRLMAEAPPGALTLLLYHSPDLMPQAASLGVDVYLAGHTHGGQWRLPGFGAIVTSSRHGKRFEAGHYQEGNTHLYVSRGLGMEGFGAPRARFFCRPELVVVDLRGQAADEPSHQPGPETPALRARDGAAERA
jgi:uncharacterized protein